MWAAPLQASLTHYYLTNTVKRAPWQRWKMFSQLRKPYFLMKTLDQRSGKKIQGKNRTETVISAIYNLTFISQLSSPLEKWTSGLIRIREIKQVHESPREAMNKPRNKSWSFKSHTSTLSMQPKSSSIFKPQQNRWQWEEKTYPLYS